MPDDWIEDAVRRDLDADEAAHQDMIQDRLPWAREWIAQASEEELVQMAQTLKRKRWREGRDA